MSSFSAPTSPVARKVHYCSCCIRRIDPGENYFRQRGYDGGEAWTFKQCAHCIAVTSIWNPRDNSEGNISEDAFDFWSEGPGETLAETRAIAGWRHNWRTQSGKLWPMPQSPEVTE